MLQVQPHSDVTVQEPGLRCGSALRPVAKSRLHHGASACPPHSCKLVHACLILCPFATGLCSSLQVLELSLESCPVCCCLDPLPLSLSFPASAFSWGVRPLCLTHRIPWPWELGLVETPETRTIAHSDRNHRHTYLHTYTHLYT